MAASSSFTKTVLSAPPSSATTIAVPPSNTATTVAVPPPTTVVGPNGKKKMVLTGAMLPPVPPGMMRKEDCDRQLDALRKEMEELRKKATTGGGLPPGLGLGQENYQKHLDNMEKFYDKNQLGIDDDKEIDMDRLTEMGSDKFSDVSDLADLGGFLDDDEDVSAAVKKPKKKQPKTLAAFQDARELATTQGLSEFEWNGTWYVRGVTSKGLGVWRRRDGPASASPCSRHRERESCVGDATGCRFSEATAKRRAYCARKPSPRTSAPPTPGPAPPAPTSKKKKKKESKSSGVLSKNKYQQMKAQGKKSLGAFMNQYKLGHLGYPTSKPKKKKKSSGGGGRRARR